MILLGAVLILLGEHAATLGLPGYAGLVCGMAGGAALLWADVRLCRLHRHRCADHEEESGS